MTEFSWWFWGVLAALLVEVELIAWLPPLQRVLVRLAVLQLAPQDRARYAEEWLRELVEVKRGFIARFAFVVSLAVRAPMLRETRLRAVPPGLLGVSAEWLRREAAEDVLFAFQGAVRLVEQPLAEETASTLNQLLRDYAWDRSFASQRRRARLGRRLMKRAVIRRKLPRGMRQWIAATVRPRRGEWLDADGLVLASEAAKIHRIEVAEIRGWMRKGYIGHRREGGQLYVSGREVAECMRFLR